MKDDQSVTEDLAALREHLDADGPASRNLRWMLFAFVMLAIGAAAALLLRTETFERPVLIYAGAVERPGLPEDQSWMAMASRQSLVAYVDAGVGVHVLDDAASPAAPASPRGADWVLSAALSAEEAAPNSVVLSLRLQSATAPNEVFETDITGVSTALNDLTGRAAQQVFAWLRQGRLSDGAFDAASAEVPTNDVAREAFAKGELALADYDGRRAVEHFDEAIAAGGEHPMVRIALAKAWDLIGYEDQSKRSAKSAYDARARLSRQRQLQIEGRYRSIVGDWDRAVEIYKALREFHPNDLAYPLSIAQLQLKKGDFSGASKTIAEMRDVAAAAPGDADARVDLVEARYWHQKGNYEKSVSFSDAAIAKAKDSQNNTLLAQAYLEAIYSESDNKRRYLTDAHDLIPAIDSPRFKSAVLAEMAEQARYDADLDAAVSLYNQALAVSESVGDEVRIYEAQHGLAISLDLQNKLKASHEIKQKVLAYHMSRGANAREAILRENIGISLFKMGRFDEAEASFARALEMFEEVGDQIGLAWSPYHLSRIRSRQGRLNEAAELARKAVLNARDNPEGQLELNAKFEVAQIQFHRGAYDEARRRFDELQSAFAESGNVISAGESALMLARIAIREGDFPRARDKLKIASSTYEEGGAVYYVIDALIVRNDLAMLADEGDIDASCDRLRAAPDRDGHALIGMRARLREIRCDSVRGRMDAAEIDRRISAVEAAAETAGMIEVLIDAGALRAAVLERNASPTEAESERRRVNAFAAANGWASGVIIRIKN